MDPHDYLYTCVEAGVALAGFAALAVAIRARGGEDFSMARRGQIASLVERGLVAAAFALLPMLLLSFSLSDEVAWRIASACFFVYGSMLAVRTRVVRGAADNLIGPRTYAVLLALGLVVVFLQLGNVFAIGVEPGPALFLLAVTWLLFSAGYVFFFVLSAWVRDANGS